MSVILLKFAGGHDPDESSKKADKDLEQLIEDTIEARAQVPGFVSFSEFFVKIHYFGSSTENSSWANSPYHGRFDESREYCE